METLLAETANSRKLKLACTAIPKNSRFGQTSGMKTRIAEFRRKRGWSLERLAQETTLHRGEDVHLSTIDKLEKGKQKVTLEWLEWIGAAFGVEPYLLIFFGGENEPERRVPVIGLVSAGSWETAIQETESFALCQEGGPRTFGLLVRGESMNRVVNDEDRIFVDPDDKDLIDGKCYVIINGDGEACMKRYREGPARFEPYSTEDGHKTIMVGRDRFDVIGRVVAKSTKM